MEGELTISILMQWDSATRSFEGDVVELIGNQASFVRFPSGNELSVVAYAVGVFQYFRSIAALTREFENDGRGFVGRQGD